MKKSIFLFCLLFSECIYSQTITQLEYFIDTDLGFGNNTIVNLAHQPSNSYPVTLSLAGISPGRHFLYSRTKNSNGHWSQTTRRAFEVYTAVPAKYITAIEYFIDTDLGLANNTMVNVTAQPNNIYPVNISFAGLMPGRHFLYSRTKDASGHWSQTSRKGIEVYVNHPQPLIHGVEYFFTSDQGLGLNTYTGFATPAADGSFGFQIPANVLPNGIDTLFIRTKNNNGIWSQTVSKTKYFTIKECPANVWLGEISTDWHNAANWSCNQVPSINSDVMVVYPTKFICEVLPGKTAQCKSLVQTAGSNVKVNASAILNIKQ